MIENYKNFDCAYGGCRAYMRARASVACVIINSCKKGGTGVKRLKNYEKTVKKDRKTRVFQKNEKKIKKNEKS